MTRAAADAATEATLAAIEAIEPWDDIEADHRSAALAWVRSGVGIWRVRKPATPPEHLVSYFVLVDPGAGRCLLVHHRNAGRWLPTGGHVEPGEDPATTVARECREEVGLDVPLMAGLSTNPLFVTRTTTQGVDAGHVDVSLWYVCHADATVPLTPDPGEFHAARWWAFDEVVAAPAGTVDPHLPRFVAKLGAESR